MKIIYTKTNKKESFIERIKKNCAENPDFATAIAVIGIMLMVIIAIL
jgi:hypothetical protein